MENEFAKMMIETAEKHEKVREFKRSIGLYEPDSTVIRVSEEGHSITIHLEPNVQEYGDWINGEGADICLLRARDDDRVVGACLPLTHKSVYLIADRAEAKQ